MVYSCGEPDEEQNEDKKQSGMCRRRQRAGSIPHFAGYRLYLCCVYWDISMDRIWQLCEICICGNSMALFESLNEDNKA